MNDKLFKELEAIIRVQTQTIGDFLEICTKLKDRIEALEEKVNK